MRSIRPWTAVVGGACFLIGFLSFLGLAVLVGVIDAPLRAAAPAEPIVLSYRETPNFLGPHEHAVTSLAFSPDGRTLATAAQDGYLRLWDTRSGRLTSILGDDAMRGIQGVAFSPGGRSVAAVGVLLGLDVELWDTDLGRLAKSYEEQVGSGTVTELIYKGKPVTGRLTSAVAFSPDGKVLATAGDGVVLRDTQSGNVLATLKQPAKGVKSLAFSADGTTLVTAAEDRKVRLWSVPTGILHETLAGADLPLSAVAISSDGTRIVAAGSGKQSLFSRGEDPIGRLFEWARPRGAVRKIDLGNVRVRQLALIEPATVVVGAGNDLLAVDLLGDASTRPRKLAAHSQEVLAVAVSPDGRLAASGGADRTVDIIERASGKLVHRLPGLTDIVSAVATSSDGKWFATATIDLRFTNRTAATAVSFDDCYKAHFADPTSASRLQPGEVRIWSTGDGRLQATLPLPACQVTAIAAVPGTDLLAVAGWLPGKGGMLALWNSASGMQQGEFAVGRSEVLALALSADGQTLASGDAAGNVELWDTRSATRRRGHKHDQRIEALAFSADARLLAIGDAHRTVQIVEVIDGSQQRTLKSSSHIKSMAFSPDGKSLAAGTRHPGLELWDLAGDGASRTLKAPGDYFETMPGLVAFSPDGRFIVCGGEGKDIAVFNASQGTLHGALRGHFHAPTAAAFLPDGRLVSGGEERTIRLWDVDGSKLLATWVVMPRDQKQHWQDEWVGYTPAGQFTGSEHLNRLVGWRTAGEVIGPEESRRRERVDRLFQAVKAEPSKSD